MPSKPRRTRLSAILLNAPTKYIAERVTPRFCRTLSARWLNKSAWERPGGSLKQHCDMLICSRKNSFSKSEWILMSGRTVGTLPKAPFSTKGGYYVLLDIYLVPGSSIFRLTCYSPCSCHAVPRSSYFTPLYFSSHIRTHAHYDRRWQPQCGCVATTPILSGT